MGLVGWGGRAVVSAGRVTMVWQDNVLGALIIFFLSYQHLGSPTREYWSRQTKHVIYLLELLNFHINGL